MMGGGGLGGGGTLSCTYGVCLIEIKTAVNSCRPI